MHNVCSHHSRPYFSAWVSSVAEVIFLVSFVFFSLSCSYGGSTWNTQATHSSGRPKWMTVRSSVYVCVSGGVSVQYRYHTR
jgi:hypothetical protein